MSKEQITYAGYSRLNGVLKFRTATTEGRVNQITRTDTDVHMLLIRPVSTKAEAARELLVLGHMSGDKEIEQLYARKALDDNPFSSNKKKTAVVVKVPTQFAVKAQGAQVEVSEKMTAREAARIRDEFNAKVRAAYEAN
jgi:hypothetical protein